MGAEFHQAPGVWALAESQKGLITRAQLGALGFSDKAVRHRVARGRLHPVWPGVYAVGRPELTREALWLAAVLTCGSGAALSHQSAGALWGILPAPVAPIAVSIPAERTRRRAGIAVHRRTGLREHTVSFEGVALTSPAWTLADLGSMLSQGRLDDAINQADRLELIDPESLRAGLAGLPRSPGRTRLRERLDCHTATRTDSALERLFLSLVVRAGLPPPRTQQQLNGFRVDFFWPEIGLVVETDGLRYHRTATQQARDLQRDQAHTAAGLTCLRFSHAQVVRHPEQVVQTLVATFSRLRR